MFDWFKRLFGEARVVVEGETTDGRTFTSKPAEVIGSFDEKELLENLAAELDFKYGVTVSRIRVLRIIGYTSGGQMSGKWFSRKVKT